MRTREILFDVRCCVHAYVCVCAYLCLCVVCCVLCVCVCACLCVCVCACLCVCVCVCVCVYSLLGQTGIGEVPPQRPEHPVCRKPHQAEWCLRFLLDQNRRRASLRAGWRPSLSQCLHRIKKNMLTCTVSCQYVRLCSSHPPLALEMYSGSQKRKV